MRIRTLTCGVCHSDVLAVEGQRPDPQQPIVPGHEIVGIIDAVGDGVGNWAVGDRVGLGFLGGQCNSCDFCRRGDFVNCTDQPLPGTSTDGGYAEIVYARATGLVRVPDGLDASVAAPCSARVSRRSMRFAGPQPSLMRWSRWQGLGGLGHLGVQYAKKLGYRVAAIARGSEKAALATTLGADHYIDSAADDPGAALTALGVRPPSSRPRPAAPP